MIFSILIYTGPASCLKFTTLPQPIPKDNELLVCVKYFALNRMDILQRQGLYPLPPGASSLLGVELAGQVVQSPIRSSFQKNDLVFGLVPGGAYAEVCLNPSNMLMAHLC